MMQLINQGLKRYLFTANKVNVMDFINIKVFIGQVKK